MLVHVDLDGAGHLGRSGRTAAREETAEELAYYLWAFDPPRANPIAPPP